MGVKAKADHCSHGTSSCVWRDIWMGSDTISSEIDERTSPTYTWNHDFFCRFSENVTIIWPLLLAPPSIPFQNASTLSLISCSIPSSATPGLPIYSFLIRLWESLARTMVTSSTSNTRGFTVPNNRWNKIECRTAWRTSFVKWRSRIYISWTKLRRINWEVGITYEIDCYSWIGVARRPCCVHISDQADRGRDTGNRAGKERAAAWVQPECRRR